MVVVGGASKQRSWRRVPVVEVAQPDGQVVRQSGRVRSPTRASKGGREALEHAVVRRIAFLGVGCACHRARCRRRWLLVLTPAQDHLTALRGRIGEGVWQL